MIRSAAVALLAMTAAATSSGQSPADEPLRVADAPAQPRLLRFEDKEALGCRRLPPDAPARINAQRNGDELTVTVLSNFGCGTTAGEAAVWRDRETLMLFARTILPDVPTPHCLCTRELRYTIEHPDAARIRYHQDRRPAVEAEVR